MNLLKKYLFATFLFCAGAFLPLNQAFSAPQEGWFAGGGFVSTITDSKSEVTGSSTLINFSDSGTMSDQGSSWELQGGYTYPNRRFYGNFSTDTVKNGELSTLLILADWLHESGFFIGGGGGMSPLKSSKMKPIHQFASKV